MILDDVRTFCHLEDVVYHVRNLLGSSESKNSTAMALFNKFGETKEAPIKEIIPFSSVYKYSGIVYDNGDRLIMGAPEYLLDKNDNRLSIVDEMAHLGKRVIALKLNDKLLCFFIISDHIRESARDTLKFFSENNVDVKVISGDNPITVSKIAKDCGIQNSDKYISLEGVSLEDIHNIATEYTVFGRVSPEQKEALVVALKDKGRKVAMTGDGVNDILALRKADSSISFANATEAAKSVSDVILLDNDFSHLKEVVGEGRRVIGNVQKTAILFLMKSIAIILLAFFTSPLSKGQMWFTIENSYMLEATVIGTGGFFISISAGSKDPLKGSFVKNIRMKAIVAGLLAAVAIIIPILCFTIPSYFNQAPIIKAENVKTMVTILLTIAGYVVLLTLCLPFKGQQAFAFLITLVPGTILAFALPTSYIGGDPTGPEMFIDKTGTSFYNCQFFHELFQPWNASVIMNFYSDYKNYIVLAGEKDEDFDFRCGYYGEKIVLYAQQLGLNTCWTALTFNKKRVKEIVAPGDSLCMVIALGYGETQGSSHRGKRIDDVVISRGEMPEWFRSGVEAALKAPTAVNQQKFAFGMKDGAPAVKVKGIGVHTKVDAGIVAYHFEIGSGRKVTFI
jgi:cation-transporting ATPase E